jgi:hypothetical protein
MEPGERLPVVVPFGTSTTGEDCFPARLRLRRPLVADAILPARFAGVLQTDTKASTACRASVAVTVPDAIPARSIRTAPSVLALR